MNKKRILGLTLVTVLTAGSMTSCVKPFQEKIYESIETHESGFLIPLLGDTTEQGQFESEEILKQNMVATKMVEIPTTWLQKGRMSFDGEYIPTMKLIKVDRTAQTREWTESSDNGTSNVNQGITAESKESISFMVRMSCTASIEENNAPKFLYHYNTKNLSQIMDTEIRALVESTFNEECARLTMDEILEKKQDIMNVVRSTVTSTFAEKGITISQLGLKGDITYSDKKIQEAINAKFTAEKEQQAQQIANETAVSKAKAESEAIKEQASTLSEQIRLKEAEAEVIRAQAALKQAEAMAGWTQVQVIGDTSILKTME